MIPQLEQAMAPKDYEELPEMIKASYSPKEWMWLSDSEKARLIQNETEPEGFDE